MILDMHIVGAMGMRGSVVLLMLVVLAGWPLQAHAGDPDQGMSRAWNIEEPWIENAYYIYASRDNSNAPGHTVSASVERDVAFSRRWGAEIDGPGVMAVQPLGKGAVAMTPLSFGLKFAPWQWGSDDEDSAGIIDFEVEGGWWPRPQPQNFPGTGSSMTEQVLIGLRQSSRWLQGQYAVTQRLGADARSGWSANTAIGQRLSQIWSVQLELDLNHTSVAANGATTLGITWIPQVCMQIGHAWEMVVGESFARVGGQSGYTGTTNVLFEYRFDNDEDSPDGS